MLAVRCRLSRRQAIIDIGIQQFDAGAYALTPVASAPAMPINSYRALIDTGAQRTCLTNHVISAERLIRHGHRHIRNVHSEATHSLFMTMLGIFAGDDGNQDGEFEPSKTYFGLEEPVEVINIADNDNFDAIIGMDVLERFDFRFTRAGIFELDLR